jgi:hypothetical protein
MTLQSPAVGCFNVDCAHGGEIRSENRFMLTVFGNGSPLDNFDFFAARLSLTGVWIFEI